MTVVRPAAQPERAVAGRWMGAGSSEADPAGRATTLAPVDSQRSDRRVRRQLHATRRAVAALALAITLAVAGCASDGRELRDALPSQTTTTRPPPPTSAPIREVSPSGLELDSPDFEAGAVAPVDTTCEGANLFPNLSWSGVPLAAVELAVTLSDQTDPEEPLLLWLMAGISPGESGLDAGTAPAGSFETLNDYGNLGYGSPCIDGLDGRRDLQFRVYALESPSGLAGGDPGNTSWDRLRAQATDSATLLMRIEPS